MASQYLITLSGHIYNAATDSTFEQDDRLSPFADYVTWLRCGNAPVFQIEEAVFIWNGERVYP